MKKRAAIYIDGFNLYHSVKELGFNHLMWCDFWRLGEMILPSQGESLVKAVFFTAFYPGDFGKSVRHRAFNDALGLRGVEVVLGNYIKVPACETCSPGKTRPSEKETDINLALHLFNDARHDRFDHAYLLSADSDQAATARLLKQEFPEKKLTTVSPPNRNFSHSILHFADHKIALKESHIERAVFKGPIVLAPSGGKAIRRPFEYDPPAGWVHPDDRP